MKILQIILLSLLVYGCASSEKLKQSTQQITVDGLSNDWPKLVNFDKTLKIVYGVSYDDSHLYVIARTYDENTKRGIISSGLTVWINPDGKKKKDIGVKYPIMNSGAGNRKGNKGPNNDPNKKLSQDKFKSIMLKGIISNEMKVVQKNYLKIDLDVEVKFDSSGHLLYEMKIPLGLLKQKAKNDLEKIAIGFEMSKPVRSTNVSGPPPERTQSSRPSGGSRGGGGGRGGRSGGGRSGGGAQSVPQSAPSNKPPIFWYQVEL